MRKFIYIILFAFVGGALRQALTMWSGNDHFIMTIAINLCGSFLLAYVSSALVEMDWVSADLMTGISVGLIGSFTTFSTFAVDSIKLSSHLTVAVTYVLVSLIGGYVLALLGRKLGQWQLTREA